jgi:hypothetical protein
MGNIYKNAYIAISASMAATGEEGCFRNRRLLQTRLKHIARTSSHPERTWDYFTTPKLISEAPVKLASSKKSSSPLEGVDFENLSSTKSVAENQVEKITA